MTNTNWIDRLLGLFRKTPATRTEMIDLLSDDSLVKELDADELSMLRGVLEVSETQVREVMIPRSHMVVIERESPKEQVLKTIVKSGHSRFPVIGEDRDEVAGILLAKDVLAHFVSNPGETFDISRFLRSVTVIPESKRLDTLLKEFRVSRNHMAIVVDEYGSTSGLMTIEDVLEEIVGEIDDEHDPQEVERIQKHGEAGFQVRALTRIEEFNEYFGSKLKDDEYDTVGGLVIHELGHMPRRGERVLVDGFQFKVLQADRRRVHTLEVRSGEALSGSESAITP
jgi:magnesium and cobalt transporter